MTCQSHNPLRGQIHAYQGALRKRIEPLLVLAFLLVHFGGEAQVINGYAKVTSIVSTTLSVSNIDESGDSFEDGEKVIILQMQDDVIGTNTSDNSSFGDLGAIASAGLYEINTISSHTESSGAPTTITLVNSLSNSFNTGTNSAVQIITFPTFGSPDYTTTSNISTRKWDGNIGGVTAFNVPGVLTLAHSISATATGLRGAFPNLGGSAGCNGNTDFRFVSDNNHADKGEGIYKSTNTSFVAGMGKILSGGGGGNSHNAGGGGGGNFSAGGQGGPGWPTCSPTAGGIGGIDLSAHISSTRIFMGGGGGAGEANNGGSQKAGNGGGIVLIKATEITSGGCSGSLDISADGESVTTGSGNDGNSGGGSGGTIVFEIDTWSIDPACPLTISSSGGNGGDVNHGAMHGGGGGGGLGAIIFSGAQPTGNITISNSAGTGGINCIGCGNADSGAGPDGSGVIENVSGPLPIELLHFQARAIENLKQVKLSWQTLSEINNDYYTVQRSKDGFNWQWVAEVDGSTMSLDLLSYAVIDESPLSGRSYYRLKQTDIDGQFFYSSIVAIELSDELETPILIFPNPATNTITIQASPDETDRLMLFDVLGRNVTSKVRFITRGKNEAIADISSLTPGYYIVVSRSFTVKIKKLGW